MWYCPRSARLLRFFLDSHLLELVTQCNLIWYSVGESNPSFPPWKGGVLADRRTEQYKLKFLKNECKYITPTEKVKHFFFLLQKNNKLGVGDRNRTCIKRICNPPPNRSVAHPHKFWYPYSDSNRENYSFWESRLYQFVHRGIGGG